MFSFEGFRGAVADFIQEFAPHNLELDTIGRKAVFTPTAMQLLTQLNDYAVSTPLWQQASEMPQQGEFRASVDTAAKAVMHFLEKINAAPTMAHANSTAILCIPIIFELAKKERINGVEL